MTIENQYDDAEFALFLQGEEALSRTLKALPQEGPPPALDAAILSTIEAALAQEKAQGRIVQNQLPAANDPVGPKNDNAVPVGSWLRSKNKPFWKITVGIAAGVLMTILFKTVWIPSDDRSMRTALLNAPSSSVSFHAPAPAPAPDMTLPAARMQPSQTPVAAPVLPTMEIEPSKPVAVAPPAASVITVPAMPAPMVTTTPPAPPAPSDRVQRVEITGVAVRRADKETASPVQVTTAADIARSGYSNTSSDDNFSSGMEKAWTWDPARAANSEKAKRAQDAATSSGFAANSPSATEQHARAAIVHAPLPTSAASAVAIESTAEKAQTIGLVVAPVGGVDKKLEQRAGADQSDQAAKAWIALIEEQLKEKLNDKALEQWSTFRKEYPNYVVPDDLAKQIKALEDSAPKK